MKEWLVSDVMSTDVATARQDTAVTKIIEALAVQGVSGVLILDERDHVVGLVSPDDLLPGIAATHRHGARAPHRYRATKAAATQAWQLLSTPAPIISAHAPLSAAADLMRSEKVKQLVVTDDCGRLLGIVSRADLFRLNVRRNLAVRHDVIHSVRDDASLIDGPVKV